MVQTNFYQDKYTVFNTVFVCAFNIHCNAIEIYYFYLLYTVLIYQTVYEKAFAVLCVRTADFVFIFCFCHFCIPSNAILKITQKSSFFQKKSLRNLSF